MGLPPPVIVIYDPCLLYIRCLFLRQKKNPHFCRLLCHQLYFLEIQLSQQTMVSCATQSGSSARGICRGCVFKGPCANGNDFGLYFDPKVWLFTKTTQNTQPSRLSQWIKFLMPLRSIPCRDRRNSACRSSPRKRHTDFAPQRKSLWRVG